MSNEAGAAKDVGAAQAGPARDPNGKFTDEEIWEAFTAFDLDKNNFVGLPRSGTSSSTSANRSRTRKSTR